MGAIENTIKKGSRPVTVRRRVAGVRGADGRHTAGVETVAIVKLYVQPRRRQLDRQLVGDSTVGGVEIWASKTYLAAAYVDGLVDEDDVPIFTPLNWTGLNVAPAENTSGPPGDRIEWNGRTYEVTNEENWDDAGLVSDSNYRYYDATERGPA